MRQIAWSVFFISTLLIATGVDANAQQRDYLTRAEDDIVREYQDIDTRIEVLIKMVDRRFRAAGIQTADTRKVKTGDEMDWGPEPNGTRADLLWDIRRLIEKAVDDVNNLASRGPEAMKAERKKVNLFNSAMRSLANAANRWLPLLQSLHETTKDDTEINVLEVSIGHCREIIEASKKIS